MVNATDDCQTNPSDEQLVQAALGGDLEAFEALVVRYQRQVFQLAYRILNQREEAEDAVQDVFVNVYQKLHQYNPVYRFSPWLYKITANTCISRIRRTKKVVLLNFDDEQTRQLEFRNAELPDPLMHLEQEELRQEIMRAMQKLPDSYRVILLLRYQMDLSNQEIAECLDISKENVEVKLHRARKSLRAAMTDMYTEGGVRDGLQRVK